jgi:hypothetical protein
MSVPLPIRTGARRHTLSSGSRTLLLVGALLLLGSGPAAPATIGARQPSSSTVGTARDDAQAEPIPLGEPAEAGDATLRVLEVVTGQAANDAVAAADPANGPPRDGVAYVLVRLAVENRGDRPLTLSNDDFALTGASGLVRRFLWLTPPEPALPTDIAPGEDAEGWVVLSAPVEETGLLLLYDNLALGGAWADRILALEEGAAVPGQDVAVEEADATGRDPAVPAALGEPVSTGQWRVELVEAVTGAAVFDLVDYRTGALQVEDATGASDGSVWLALRFRIANVGVDDGPATLPANAFTLADPSGAAVLDLATLTPPSPDAAGDFYPGAEREGWVAFDVPADLGPVLVRFQPYAETTVAPDPRYFTTDGS